MGCDDTDTGGVLGVFVDGTLTTGDTLSAAKDYTGLVTATVSGSYTYQMALDGVAVGEEYTGRTAPRSGDNFDLIFIGDCFTAEASFNYLWTNESPAACYATEFYYIDAAEFSASPINATPIATLQTNNNPRTATGATPETNDDFKAFRTSYRKKHRAVYTYQENRLKWVNKAPIRQVWNNHEFTSLIADPWCASPGENNFDGAFQAAQEYEFNGNPIPTGTVGTHTIGENTYNLPYFNETVGDVEVIVTDMTSANEDALGYLLDDATRGLTNQVAWIKDRISNSTANVLIIYNPTTIIASMDEWTNASTGILKTIDAKDQTIILMSANNHTPSARLINLNMPTRPVLEFGISPLRHNLASVFVELASDVVYYTDEVSTSYASAHNKNAHTNWAYGKIIRRANGDAENSNPHTKFKMINPTNGELRFSCIIEDGSRTPILPKDIATSVAVE